MKKALFFLMMFMSASAALGQSKEKKYARVSKSQVQIVEASCGECQLGMKGKSCDLAVRIEGKAYFVDGTKIDDHGDAHASDGFCKKIRKAEVKGSIIGDRYVATQFKLLTEEKAKK